MLYQKADGHTGLLRNLQIVLWENACNYKSILKNRAFRKEQSVLKTCDWKVVTLSSIDKLEKADFLPIKTINRM